MPTDEDLDAMSQAIAGVPWSALTFPEHRAKVMELALRAHANYQREDMVDHLKELAARVKGIEETLDNIAVDTESIGSWFKHSKLWEGRLT